MVVFAACPSCAHKNDQKWTLSFKYGNILKTISKLVRHRNLGWATPAYFTPLLQHSEQHRLYLFNSYLEICFRYMHIAKKNESL